MSYQILVIDDMRSIYNSITDMLKPRGCELDYAENGMNGLQKAQSKLYDLILLDIHLPDRNGLQVCSELKELIEYEHRPVLLITSDARNLEEGLIVGASDYILKPFNKVELLARVFTHIKVSHSRLSLNKEKEQLENDLASQRTKLIEMEKDLQKYFYQTSHRLRSPLNTMKGLFNLIEIDQPELLNSNYLVLLQQAIVRINKINEQVSKIGYLRSIKIHQSKFNLREFIGNIVEERGAIDSEVIIDIPSNLQLNADNEVFRLGVDPVLDNAIKYTSETLSSTGKIHISTFKNDDRIFLIIQDNGPGIREEFLYRICDMFFVGDDHSQGNGLGLFISKLAFECLNTKFMVRSKRGNFTRIVIELTNMIINNVTNNAVTHEEKRRYSA